MYCVKEYSYYVQTEGLSLLLYLDKSIYGTWLSEQQGVVRKEIWMQPESNVVKFIVTWYGSQYVELAEESNIDDLRKQLIEGVAAGGFVCSFLTEETYFSQTTIDQGVPDVDGDQDDNNDVEGNTPGGLDEDGAIMPDYDYLGEGT